jgi:co-chaperonin GroES (HSP10)
MTTVIDRRTKETPKFVDTFQKPQPVFNSILVRLPEQSTEEFQGGILIPDSSRKNPNRGVVVAISEFYILGGVKHNVSDMVNIGDEVTISDISHESIPYGDETLEIVDIFDVKLIHRKGI